MERGEHQPQLPRITEDDFFTLIFESDEQRWKQLAKEYPALFRIIEQRAHKLRHALDSHSISALDAQKEMIDASVSVAAIMFSAMKRILQTTTDKTQTTRSIEPPLAP